MDKVQGHIPSYEALNIICTVVVGATLSGIWTVPPVSYWTVELRFFNIITTTNPTILESVGVIVLNDGESVAACLPRILRLISIRVR